MRFEKVHAHFLHRQYRDPLLEHNLVEHRHQFHIAVQVHNSLKKKATRGNKIVENEPLFMT